MSCLAVACAFAHLVFAPGSTTKTFPDSLVPTWVEPVGDDLLIASAYNSIYRLSGDKLVRLGLPPDLRFVPAGMTQRDGKLYVANYLGRDVLVFDYPSMRLNRRITEGMVGPEGIYVDEAGMIDVADYNGGTITRIDSDGKIVWSQPLRLAHGVTQVGGVVYGTSLYDRTVAAFDAATGVPLGTTGSQGSVPGQYIWPVGMAADDDGLLVIDALVGRVTRLTTKLELQDIVPSGNGPGEDLFAFPYGVARNGNGYLVADAYKHRILFLDPTWRITRQVIFGPQAPRGRDLPILRPMDNPTLHITTFEPSPALGRLLGVSTQGQMVEGYNSLDLVQDGKVVHEFSLNSAAAGLPFFYWTWARQSGDFVVIGSPAQASVMIIDTKLFRIGYANTATDVWTIRGEREPRLSDGRPLALDQLVQSAEWIDLTQEKLSQIVTSDAGRAYLKDHDLAAYLRNVSERIIISVPELVAVRHLATAVG